MKKIATSALVAALAALFTLASPAMAGTLTVTSGPDFSPPGAFSNNTIVVNTTIGEGALVDLNGNATVDPSGTTQASIDISGDFSANVGDLFSAAYSFTADLNIVTPVTYTISGTATPTVGPPIVFTTTGTLMPGLHKYEGTFSAPGNFPVPVAGTYSASLVLDFGPIGAPQAAAPGTLDLAIQQIDLKLDPLPATVAAASQSQNISTRANVGTGDDALIGGFIVDGTEAKVVVLRAIGPSLTASGVVNVLNDPILELHDSTGATIGTNDNWMDLSASDQTILTDNGLAPTEDAESALVATIDPGAYTVVVRGVNDTTGVALVEAYDLDNGTTDSKFANVSTRGSVGIGEDVMIGGFIVGGGGGGFEQVIVRGIGPSLAVAGVTDPLADPMIEVRNVDGDVVDSNDNWEDDPNADTIATSGLAPTDPNESAAYEILPAGAYTAVLSGVGGTTGTGLVEAYNID
ncbi:MAG: hypothetical protein ABI016_16470 [Chthoniobacterales bacterium]